VLAAVFATFPAAPASAAAASKPAQLQAMLEQLVHAHPAFPGAALSVRAPGFGWEGAAGVADPATKAPLRAHATFRIASVTKTFTAAAILRLVEQGKISLDDPIAAHLDPRTVALLEGGGYDVPSILVRHLLRHTSGLYDYASDTTFVQFVVGHGRHRWTREEQVRYAVTHGAPLGAPGADFHYSDTGYILLGEMLERATGEPLAAAYRTLLRFGRLGLDETYLETLERRPPHARPRAHQFLETFDNYRWDPSFDLYGGGGLVSTVDDLTRFYQALLGGRVFDHPATMLGAAGRASPDTLGMGIFPFSLGAETCWHHDGFWGVSVVHCPRSRLTMAMTVNQFQGFERPSQRLLARVRLLVR
jgi:D-alanyl-D-alanine carboxypeptidase